MEPTEVCMHATSLQSYLTLLTPWSVARQAPVPEYRNSSILELEWVAILSSRGSSWPKEQTCFSYVSFIGRRVFFCLFFKLLAPPEKPTEICGEGQKVAQERYPGWLWCKTSFIFSLTSIWPAGSLSSSPSCSGLWGADLKETHSNGAPIPLPSLEPGGEGEWDGTLRVGLNCLCP